MKKTLLLSVCTIALITLGGCNNHKNTKNAGNVASEYAMSLQNGNYALFVDNMDFGEGMARDEMRREKAKYVRLMNEKIDPLLKGKGGIKRVKVKSESAANDGQTATVVLTNTYNNGQTEDITYDLVWVDNQWKIDMDKHRQVWKTKTADGRDVSFTLKDYDDKQVFKQDVDGDREFVKMIDEGDKQVVKVKEDGDRMVEKVKEKDDEVVIKEKVNGDKEVATIPTK